jgi:hypothetical protein
MLQWLLEQGTKYEPLIKTGASILMGAASYKDQKRKNEMQQAAYDDYMRQVAGAGQEARAAIDLGRTGALPMVLTGVPQTKADVTDFTAVAARGGLMSIPNKQRKRYARGPEEVDVMEFDEESITPFGLQQETGLDLTGEQVKYETGNSRQDAWGVWNSGGIDQEIYEFDFEIFFDSGDWMDMIKSQAPATGNMQMASSDMGDPMDNADEHSMRMFNGKKYNELTPIEIEIFEEEMLRLQNKFMANGGIAGLRHGGRPGYAERGFVNPQTFMTEEEASTGNPGNAEMYAEEIRESQPSGVDVLNKVILMTADGMVAISQEDWIKVQNGEITQEEALANAGYESGIKKIEFKKGGRVKRDNGGIMNLGGLEKDYRTTGGFVPIGEYEKKDDVPARLSKNEFVMTADAVRAAGGGSINKGAQRMYDTMKHLEAQPTAKRMTA